MNAANGWLALEGLAPRQKHLACSFFLSHVYLLGCAPQIMANNKVHYMSKKQDWGTPPQFLGYLIDELNVEFCLDVAASPHNAKAPSYFTKEMNGLKQTWSGTVWVNPPFGSELKHWVKKACDEAVNARIFMLIPCRPDTRYFHELIMKNATNIYLIKGRFNFLFEGAIPGANSPFPSMLVEFNWAGQHNIPPQFHTLEPSPMERGY